MVDHPPGYIGTDDGGGVLFKRPLQRRFDRICQTSGEDVGRNVVLDWTKLGGGTSGKVKVSCLLVFLVLVFFVKLFDDESGIATIPHVNRRPEHRRQLVRHVKRMILKQQKLRASVSDPSQNYDCFVVSDIIIVASVIVAYLPKFW